jgi:hypothetical protein
MARAAEERPGDELRRAGESVRFQATRYGCDDRLAAIERVSGPQGATAPERTAYRERAGGEELEEWYAPGAKGLEQGFTLAGDPCRGADGDVVIEVRFDALGGVATTERLDAIEAAGGRGVDLRDRRGRVRAHYADLSARDANGATLAARMVARAGGVALHVDARRAAFPVVVDPVAWFETGQLLPSDSSEYDGFGSSVAFSGSTLVVGAAYALVGPVVAPGAVYVFEQSGSTWTQQEKLYANDGAHDDALGYSISMSGDTVVAGAPYAAVYGNATQGAAYVFVRSGTTWVQQAKLIAADGAPGDYFGDAVAIQGDVIFVGAPNHATNGDSSRGEVNVFTRTGAKWTEQTPLVAADGAARDSFGFTLSADGSDLIVAAVGAMGNQGAAYVFTGSGATWTQQGELIANDQGAGSGYGYAVGISGDTAVVGSFEAAIGQNEVQGAAHVFTRSGTTWSQQQLLVPNEGAMGQRFGSGLAIDGDTLIISGVWGPTPTAPLIGAVYVYASSAGTWAESQPVLPVGGATNLGWGPPVAIQGTEAAIGGDGIAHLAAVSEIAATSCATDADCGSGHCADGVCCDAACDGQCEACDVAGSIGTCSAVTGPPHTGRAPCAGAGSACAGSCDGATSRTACTTFPGAKVACASACAGASLTDSVCDGQGGCVASGTHACPNGLVCQSATACTPRCASDADCLPGFVCDASTGRCNPRPGNRCIDDHTAIDSAGHRTTCDPYVCSGGQCGQACVTVNDCTEASACDAHGRCVPLAGAKTPGGCSCTAAGTPATPPSLAMSAFAALALWRSRRRGARAEGARRGPAEGSGK